MDAWWLEPTGEVGVTIACGGDCGLVGRLRALGRAHGYDRVLRAPATLLQAADIATANLEFPVAAASPGHEFYHDRDALAALRRAGVTVVSLANNHMMDLGVAGLEATLEACAAAGLRTVGAGADLEQATRPLVLEARGRRVGMLAYATPHPGSAGPDRAGVAPFVPDSVRRDVRALRARADLVVVHAHWGSMYVDDPPPYVLDWAALLADLGVDLVVGHHPHVLQGIERRGRTLVAYSLGDLVFDPSAGRFRAEVGREKRRQGGVATAALAREAHGLRFAPLTQDDDFVPRAPDAAEARRIEDRLRAMSASLGQARDRFVTHSGPELVRYELQNLGEKLRRGHIGEAARLLLAVRPRHLPILWRYLTRGGRREGAGA